MMGAPIDGGLAAGAPAAAPAAAAPAQDEPIEEGSNFRMQGAGTTIPRTPLYISRDEVQEAMRDIVDEATELMAEEEEEPDVPSLYLSTLRQQEHIVAVQETAQEVMDEYEAAWDRELERWETLRTMAEEGFDQKLADQYGMVVSWLEAERTEAVADALSQLRAALVPYGAGSLYYGTHQWFQRPGPSAATTDQESTRGTFRNAHLGTASAAGAGAGTGGGIMGGMGPMGLAGPGGMSGAAGGDCPQGGSHTAGTTDDNGRTHCSKCGQFM